MKGASAQEKAKRRRFKAKQAESEVGHTSWLSPSRFAPRGKSVRLSQPGRIAMIGERSISLRTSQFQKRNASRVFPTFHQVRSLSQFEVRPVEGYFFMKFSASR